MRLRLGKWSWLIIGIGLLCVLGLLSERHSAGSQAGHAQMSRNRVAVRGGTLPLNEVAAVSSRGSPNSITSGNPSMAALQAKVAHLEEKLDGMLNQVPDTTIWCVITANCTHKICTLEMGKMAQFHGPGHLRIEGQGQWEQCVCADNTIFAPGGAGGQGSGCVAYDFGIREEAEFGVQFARAGCEVHAFDPSPTTANYMRDKFENEFKPYLSTLHKQYHFHPYGGGGTDGTVALFGYNWDQVTIRRPPKGQEGKSGGERGGVFAKIRKLASVMNAYGHTWVDVLKIDIEGSEFRLLESAIDDFSDIDLANKIKSATGRDLPLGCLPTDHLMLEWHHFGYDARYNAPTFFNYFTEKMRKCGLKLFAMTLPWAPNGGKEGPYARQCFCRFCESLPLNEQFVAHGVRQTWLPQGRPEGDPPKWEHWDPTEVRV